MAHPTPVRPLYPSHHDRTVWGLQQKSGCFGVSLGPYLASEVVHGEVPGGHKPQGKAHLSEPGTHQRTWRVMGRPFHRLPQTLSMTRRNDSLCSPQDTSRWHSQRQIPAPVKISRKAQQMMTVSTLFVIQFFFLFVLSNKVFLLYLLYLSIEIFDFIYFIK